MNVQPWNLEEIKAYFELQDAFGAPKKCLCQSKTIAFRWADLGDHVCDQMAECHLEMAGDD